MKRYLTTNQRRSALKLAYSDREWINKVDKMPDKQVYAIFDKMRNDGIINFDDNGNVFFRTREEVKKKKEAKSGVHQMTIDEWLQNKNEKEIENGKIQ